MCVYVCVCVCVSVNAKFVFKLNYLKILTSYKSETLQKLLIIQGRQILTGKGGSYSMSVCKQERISVQLRFHIKLKALFNVKHEMRKK